MDVHDFGVSCEEGRKLFEEKNKQYGDSVEECGVLGVAVELIGIAGRLRQLVLRDPEHGRGNSSSVHNCFIDALNYGAIGLAMLRKDNWEGR